jgi:hypothetical protein
MADLDFVARGGSIASDEPPAKGRRRTQAAPGYDAKLVLAVVTARADHPDVGFTGRLVRGRRARPF